MKHGWLFPALLAVAGCSGTAFAQDAAQRLLAANCTTCHGPDGHSVGGVPPALAGRPKTELMRLLLEYKSGQRPATVMGQQAKGYSDAQLEEIAGYFAEVKP